jgi:hypothetical protein
MVFSSLMSTHPYHRGCTPAPDEAWPETTVEARARPGQDRRFSHGLAPWRRTQRAIHHAAAATEPSSVLTLSGLHASCWVQYR